MIAMPSPSEMRWLRRRDPGTSGFSVTGSEPGGRARLEDLPVGPVVAGRHEDLDQRRAVRARRDGVRDVRRDDPGAARLEVARFVTDPEGHRSAKQDPDLLVDVRV